MSGLLSTRVDWVSMVLSVKVWEPAEPQLGRRWKPELTRGQDGDQEVSMSSLCSASSEARLFILGEWSGVEFYSFGILPCFSHNI